MSVFKFLLLFFSCHVLAQSPNAVIENKLRPLIFQAEQQLDLQLKEDLKASSGIDSLLVQTRLSVNIQKIVDRSGILTTTDRVPLPGLDETTRIVQATADHFEPTLNDVFLAATNLEVKVISNNELSKIEKNNFKNIIDGSIKTLKLSKTNINFQVSTLPVKGEKMKEVEKATSQKTDYSPYYWVITSVIGGILLLVLMIYVIAKLGLKKMEEFSRSLIQTLSSIQITLPDNKSSETPNQKREYHQNSSSMRVETLDDLNQQIRTILQKHHQQLQTIVKIFFAMGSPSKSYLLLDNLNDSDRNQVKSCLTGEALENYTIFLEDLSNGQISEESLLQASHQLLRELSLFSHDPTLLKKSILKSKLNSLEPEAIKRLIENSSALEFGHLMQMSNPITLSKVLTEAPHLLSKFETIPDIKLTASDIESFLKKIDDVTNQLQRSAVHRHLSDYLPLALEKELNKKLGIKETAWERLTESDQDYLIRYCHSLTIDDLSAFMAILPEALQDKIWNELPDLKASRIKGRGIKLNMKSYELKYEFLQQIKNIQ